MAYKPLYDWMDKHEGRKDSSYEAVQKERARQGYPKDQAYQPSKSGGILIRKNQVAKKMKHKAYKIKPSAKKHFDDLNKYETN